MKAMGNRAVAIEIAAGASAPAGVSGLSPTRLVGPPSERFRNGYSVSGRRALGALGSAPIVGRRLVAVEALERPVHAGHRSGQRELRLARITRLERWGAFGRGRDPEPCLRRFA